MFSSPLKRRTLLRSGITLPLAASAVATAGTGVAMADGTDAPANGNTLIVDRTLDTDQSASDTGSDRANDQGRYVTGYATMAAATWTGDDPDTVEIQAQNLQGEWGEWLNAELLTDAGAKATDASWVGPSQAVRVRATRSGQDVTAELTAHLIATSAAATDIDGAGTGRGTAVGLAPRTAAQTGTHGPSIINRAMWGADETWARTTSTADRLRSVIIHHTAGSNSYTSSQSAQVVRGIYSYHTQTLGWSDIGYNALVDKFGRIYEGRRGGLETHRTGAHAYGFNTSSFGISVLGDYQSVSVPTVALDSVARLAAWKLAGVFATGVHETVTYTGISPNPQLQRSGDVAVPRLIGHRDVNRTDCPGNRFYNQFGTLRSLVAAHMSRANKDHLNAFKASGGENSLGTVFHIENNKGQYRVTRLTSGIILTAGGFTRAWRTRFARDWTPAWGIPLSSTTGTTQQFTGGTATYANGATTFTKGTPGTRFIDVPDTLTFAREINTLADRGILKGWSDHTFRPQQDVWRDAVIVFLYRIAGSPAYTPPRTSPFLDVPTSRVFYKELCWAYETGIAQGWQVRGGNEFRPELPVLRDAMAAFIARANHANVNNTTFNGFVDVNSSLVFQKHINWMGQMGISTGWPDRTYRPFNTTKRAELAAFLYRDMERRGLL